MSRIGHRSSCLDLSDLATIRGSVSRSLAYDISFAEETNNSATLKRNIYFGHLVYPRGSYVITHVRPSVGPSIFKYLRDRSKDFSDFSHEVRAP